MLPGRLPLVLSVPLSPHHLPTGHTATGNTPGETAHCLQSMLKVGYIVALKLSLNIKIQRSGDEQMLFETQLTRYSCKT